jgi:hypothetical protein
MKKTAALLLIAIAVGSAGYFASATVVPRLESCFDRNTDLSDLTPYLIPDWHFKRPHIPRACFGLCPEMEN